MVGATSFAQVWRRLESSWEKYEEITNCPTSDDGDQVQVSLTQGARLASITAGRDGHYHLPCNRATVQPNAQFHEVASFFLLALLQEIQGLLLLLDGMPEPSRGKLNQPITRMPWLNHSSQSG
jgi:hypothetical protein